MSKFSARYLDALKPRTRQYDVLESDGFSVRVFPSGSKSFLFVYRKQGKLRRVTIGRYPAMTLKDARAEYHRLWEDLQNGGDPASERSRRKYNFSELAEEYLDKKARPTKKTWREDARIIEKDLVPAFGDIHAGELRRRDVLLFLEGLRDSRKLGRQVNIIHGLIRRIYHFGLEREFPGLEFNPAADIGRIGDEGEKDRALSPAEVGEFWRVIPQQRIDESTARCLMFILATAQRPGECLFIERSEIDGRWWTIPKEKMKTAKTRQDKVREHRVYLSDLAIELLGDEPIPFPVPSAVSALATALRRSFGAVDRELISRARALAEQGLSAKEIGEALGVSHQKVGAMLSPSFHARLSMPAFTPHDLRRTAATLLAGNGVRQETIDKCLGHTMGKIQRVYNRYSYDAEKQEAMMVLEAAIRRAITSGSPEQNQ